MIAAGIPEELLPDGDPDMASAACMVMMVNDLVIKIAPAQLDVGGFCYDVFPWQRRSGMIWGKGIARQVRTPQRMLNAAVRAQMDNGALTSGPLWGIREEWIKPLEGGWSLTPRKGFKMTSSAPDTAKIQDAISFTNVQSNINELNLVIDRALRFAEDATGLPMLMQGQQGEATTTATGMTILNNNGSTVLRRIARTFDDCVTEPHIRRYYYWLLNNSQHDDAKGDFQIDARGSSFLVERDLQAQNLNMLFPQFAQHPDVHPGRLAEEVARANRINYERIMLTDAEKAEKAKQPPPEMPQVTVARLNNEQRERESQRKSQIDQAGLQAKFELGLGQLAADGKISEDNIKALLATTLMRMQGASEDKREDRAHQYGMSDDDRRHDKNMAAVESPGRAPAHEGVSR
jgi:hypothetical protein